MLSAGIVTVEAGIGILKSIVIGFLLNGKDVILIPENKLTIGS